MEKSTVRLKMTRPCRHSMTPLSAGSSYDNENQACSSRVMELPEVAENLPRVASEKEYWTKSKNKYNFLIIDTFGHYVWKAIAPEATNSGTLKLCFEVRRVCTIYGSPHPLLVIYMYGARASNYTCRSNIPYLLYDNENWAHSSRVMGLSEVANNSPRVGSEKEHGMESEKYIQFSDHWYFRTLRSESYSSRSKQFSNTKIRTRSAKGLYYRQKFLPTSGNLYIWHKLVRLYISGVWIYITYSKSMSFRCRKLWRHGFKPANWFFP